MASGLSVRMGGRAWRFPAAIIDQLTQVLPIPILTVGSGIAEWFGPMVAMHSPAHSCFIAQSQKNLQVDERLDLVTGSCPREDQAWQA
jgi:hypothetical protein